MLVLARKVDESLVIGDDIEVKILSIDGDTVRIGVEAPKNVLILRRELYAQVAEENRSATGVASEDADRLSRML